MIQPLILGLFVILSLAEAGESGDSAEFEKLDRGELVVSSHVCEGEPLKRGMVTGVIDIPPWKALKAVMDYNRAEEYIPYVRESEVLDVAGKTIFLYTVLDVPWPLYDVWYLLRVDHEFSDDCYRVQWTYIDGNINTTSGYWLVEPWSGGETRTKLTYSVLVDPGYPFIPKFLVNLGTRIALPGLIKAIHSRATTHEYTNDITKPIDELVVKTEKEIKLPPF